MDTLLQRKFDNARPAIGLLLGYAIGLFAWGVGAADFAAVIWVLLIGLVMHDFVFENFIERATWRKAYIEQIGTGHPKMALPFGINIEESPDVLCISNGDGIPFISWLSGYKQYGTFNVYRPHVFKERQTVKIKIKDNKILAVKAR